MEVVQISICILIFIFIMFIPRLEKTSFVLLIIGWLFMMFLYLGHTAHAVFSNVNL